MVASMLQEAVLCPWKKSRIVQKIGLGYPAPLSQIIFVKEVKQCCVRTVPDELHRLGCSDAAAAVSLMLLRMIYI
jgi:hypothetical protein